MKFKDKLQREWDLSISVAAMRRAKKLGIDLSSPVSQLQDFVMDDVFLCDALFAIVQPQCETAGVSQEQFDAGFDGNFIEAARDTLWKALEEYFAPGKAEMLLAAVASVRKEMQEATKSLTSTGSGESKENSAET